MLLTETWLREYGGKGVCVDSIWSFFRTNHGGGIAGIFLEHLL